jgi:hypothetical protein
MIWHGDGMAEEHSGPSAEQIRHLRDKARFIRLETIRLTVIRGCEARRHGIYDEYSVIAPPSGLYAHYRLDADGIRRQAPMQLQGKGHR